jgi:hypothetical protein
MSFDLNINNYTNEELIDIFELPTNFDKAMAEDRLIYMSNNVFNEANIDDQTKLKTIQFLTEAKNRILRDNVEVRSDANHNILNKEITPYVYSFPNEYFQGTVNPIKKRTIFQNIYIDTRFRDSYYNSSASNFIISLPFKLDNVVQMQLIAIELPSVIYAVNESYNNNYFTIIVNGSELKIQIPYGNYTTSSIMTAINTILNSYGAPFNYVTFSADLITMKTIVEPNGSGIVSSLELNFLPEKEICVSDGNEKGNNSYTLGWSLGFRHQIYKEEIQYISEGIIDLFGSKYFYLVVDDYHNNVNDNFIGAFKTSIIHKNIIARISNRPNTPRVLLQDNLFLICPPREYFGPVNINSFNVQLLDENGNYVDLNNMNFNFCLSVITVYDL